MSLNVLIELIFLSSAQALRPFLYQRPLAYHDRLG